MSEKKYNKCSIGEARSAVSPGHKPLLDETTKKAEI